MHDPLKRTPVPWLPRIASKHASHARSRDFRTSVVVQNALTTESDNSMHCSRQTLIPLFAFAPVMLFGQASPRQPALRSPTPPPRLLPAWCSPRSAPSKALSSSLKIDKWKKGSVREESGDNVNAMLRDIKSNVPPAAGRSRCRPRRSQQIASSHQASRRSLRCSAARGRGSAGLRHPPIRSISCNRFSSSSPWRAFSSTTP